MSMPLLTRVEKVNYSLDSTAEVIAFTVTSSFLLIFYNQVRGLPVSHETAGIMWIVMGLGALGHIAYSLMTTTVYSALADIADENELKYGIRQEGVLYSTRTFFARIDQALGTALAGGVLALIAFPAKAVPGAVEPEVLSKLALATILSMIPGMFAAATYAFLKVTRATHDSTRAALDEKQRMADAAVA